MGIEELHVGVGKADVGPRLFEPDPPQRGLSQVQPPAGGVRQLRQGRGPQIDPAGDAPGWEDLIGRHPIRPWRGEEIQQHGAGQRGLDPRLRPLILQPVSSPELQRV
jgi:hypothetical protein